jgi:hypothetical protein
MHEQSGKSNLQDFGSFSSFIQYENPIPLKVLTLTGTLRL